MAGRSIVIDILGDARKFTAATKQATASATMMGKGMKGALDGLPLGFMGVAGAAAAVTAALADGVRGAIEEEQGIARLTTALKANVDGWDGNTDAIERAIRPRMDLGFADDELRDSLARLVPATKDVNQALAIQATAMDLARFKGISLADASQALVKVEAGQYRALKDLGIVLEKGATQTEALAAVQAVAAGQAAAYAETTAGSMELLQKRTDELAETVGGFLIPKLEATVDVLGTVTGALQDVDVETDNWIGTLVTGSVPELLDGISDALGNVTAHFQRIIDPIGTAEQSIRDFRAAERASLDPTKDLTGANRSLARSFNLVAQTGAEAAEAVRLAIGWQTELGYIGGSKGKKKKGADARAAGGSASGMTWVGEEGPELVDLPTGSFVHSTAQSRRMAGGAGVTVNVNGNIYGPSGVDELADMLAFRLRLDGV